MCPVLAWMIRMNSWSYFAILMARYQRAWSLVQRNFHIVSSELLMRPDWWLTRGTRQYLPRRICQREFIPQFPGKSKFGACCSSMLHTYMMMYRSRLLSMELFFCQISLVHCSLSDQAIRISVTILLKQPWSWFLLNGDGTFRMAIVATHTARMVSIEDD